jgi:hypothetical protein
MFCAAQLILTDRDVAIVAMVQAYGGLRIAQLLQRFWPTPGARAAGYARIARLVDAAYLSTRRLPATSGIGSGPLFVTLGPKARPVLAKVLGCPRGALRRASRLQVPHQIHHHVAGCEFRLALELAIEQTRRVAASEWTPEWELRRTPIKLTDPTTHDTITLVPDGVFRLTLADGRAQTFAIEIDMATMTALRRLRTRLRGYLTVARDHQRPVLWLTTTPARAATLARLAREEADKLQADATSIWIALQRAVTPQSVLAQPIWQVVGGPAALSLLHDGEERELSAPPAAARRPERRRHALALAEGR